jgi:hypothetical protein
MIGDLPEFIAGEVYEASPSTVGHHATSRHGLQVYFEKNWPAKNVERKVYPTIRASLVGKPTRI